MITQGPLETITDFALRVRYFGDQLLKQPSPPWNPDYWKQVTEPRIVEIFLNGLQKSGKYRMGDFESPKTWDDVNKIVARIEEMVFEYSKKTMAPSEKKLVDFATRLFYPDEYIDFENFENTVENTTSKVTYKESIKSSLPEKTTSLFHTTRKENTINYASTNKILLDEEIIETTELKITETPLPEKADILVQKNEISLKCDVLQTNPNSIMYYRLKPYSSRAHTM